MKQLKQCLEEESQESSNAKKERRVCVVDEEEGRVVRSRNVNSRQKKEALQKKRHLNRQRFTTIFSRLSEKHLVIKE